jgi:hypothetical protein
VAADGLVAAEGLGRPIQLQILAVEIELFDGIAQLDGGLELEPLLTGVALQARGGEGLGQGLGGTAGGHAFDHEWTFGFQGPIPRLPAEPPGESHHFRFGPPVATEGVAGLAPALELGSPLQFQSVAIEEKAGPLGGKAVQTVFSHGGAIDA